MATPRILRSQIVDVSFGEDVTVVEPSNLYGCEIGDRTFVGPFVEIQRNVRIGPDCRIQSHAFICEHVTIGRDCFISHGAMFINDRFAGGDRARGDSDLYVPTLLGDHVLIGTNATILPVSIVDHVCVGAGSVVTRDLLEPGVYAGNPARLISRSTTRHEDPLR